MSCKGVLFSFEGLSDSAEEAMFVLVDTDDQTEC